MNATQKIKKSNWLVKLIHKVFKPIDLQKPKILRKDNLLELDERFKWRKKIEYETGKKVLITLWFGDGDENRYLHYGEIVEVIKTNIDGCDGKILRGIFNDGEEKVLIKSELLPLESIITGRPKVIGKL